MINKRNAARATRELLAERFPACFKPKGAMKLPLKIGIYHDVLAALPEVGRHRLHDAFADYTNGPKYLTQIVEGAVRVALDGSPAGLVTAKEAEHARIRMFAFASWAKSQKIPEAAE